MKISAVEFLACPEVSPKGGMPRLTAYATTMLHFATFMRMTLFRDRYRAESARKPYWDYSSPGRYFVTICTKDREPHFGRVTNGSMILSAMGVYAAGCWREIPSHHPRVEIDEFIVMPNHVHGIIVITGTERLPELRKRGEIRRVQQLADVHPKPARSQLL